MVLKITSLQIALQIKKINIFLLFGNTCSHTNPTSTQSLFEFFFPWFLVNDFFSTKVLLQGFFFGVIAQPPPPPVPTPSTKIKWSVPYTSKF